MVKWQSRLKMSKIISLLSSGLFLFREIGGMRYVLVVREVALFLGFFVLGLLVFSFIVGLAGGWFLARGKKLFKLAISKKDRVLFFSPHQDDETLAAGGLLSYLSLKKISKRLVFLTNGDGNPILLARRKSAKFDPEKFVKEAIEIRFKEAKLASRRLGVKAKEIVFLGYPEVSLSRMFKRPREAVIGRMTRLTHNPYRFSSNFGKENKGENLLKNLKEEIVKFSPTVIFVSHRKDNNPDHRAVYNFVLKAIKETGWKGRLFQYLIHFRLRGIWRIYPGKKKFEESWAIYPPLKLWQKNSWFSFWLTVKEWERKKKALSAYKSQRNLPTLRGLFRSFLAHNEIFEEQRYEI